jgi:hypothetical protein
VPLLGDRKEKYIMKKTVIALILILSMLLTTACALKGGADANNAADGGNEEATTPIDDNVKDPEPKIYNPAEFSFGEGVPTFDTANLVIYFKNLNTEIENSEYIEINNHEFVKTFSDEVKMTYEEKNGKLVYASVARDADLIYAMFLSAILNQYPENSITFDYRYDPYSSNMDPMLSLFLSFELEEKGYQKPVDYLEDLLSHKVVNGQKTYIIAYYTRDISYYGIAQDDFSRGAFQELGYIEAAKSN